jgi:hypothetical protein
MLSKMLLPALSMLSKMLLPASALLLAMAAATAVNALPASQNVGIVIPVGATPVQATATGTTAATAATLPAAVGKITYICGFSIRANATAAATGEATVAGPATTMDFLQFTAPAASGIGLVEPGLGSCVPDAAANTAIVVTSAATGAGGVVSVSAWGFQL